MKLFLVDDSKAMRKMLKRYLNIAGYSGHEYAEAADGAEAFDKILQWKPDLVLSDWQMPVLSGLGLLQKLRASGNLVPFGFITASGREEQRKIGLDNGALFHVSKPFTPEKLKRALSEFIS